MAQQIELGLDTFGDITASPDGSLKSHAEVIRDVIEQGVLADQVGVDAFGLASITGRISPYPTPDVVLAAIAARTKRIWLGSAVTVLSSDDPIRVFERFSTLNAASNGRAEVTLGRGSFIESFPLFGFDLSDYEKLFEEKLDLFAALLKNEPVTWRARRARRSTISVSSRRSRKAAYDLDRRRRQPGIGGARRALRFAADARHHRRRSQAVSALCRPLPSRLCAIRQARTARRHPLARLRRRHRRPGARRVLAATTKRSRDRIGAERGWPPTTKAAFEQEVDGGALTSVRRKPSPAASPRRSRRSAPCAST